MFTNNDAFASFSVADIGAAKEFYGRTLGFDITEDAMGFLQLKLGGGGRVLVYSKPNHEPATFTVLNIVVPDIEKAVDDLAAAGVAMQQYDMPEIKTDARGIARDEYGQAIAWFADPAGNIIAVLEMPQP